MKFTLGNNFPNTNNKVPKTRNLLKITTIIVARVLGVKNLDDWIQNINIGHIMHLSFLKINEFLTPTFIIYQLSYQKILQRVNKSKKYELIIDHISFRVLLHHFFRNLISKHIRVDK